MWGHSHRAPVAAEVKEEAVGAAVQGLVAVAIDKDKGSQYALKWTVENLVVKGQTIMLVHVNHRTGIHPGPSDSKDDAIIALKEQLDAQTKALFLPFRCFCTRKDIHCKDIVLEDHDIGKAIIEFVSQYAIEKLVVGAPSKNVFLRFKSADVPTTVTKGAPDFCSVYVISKGKISCMRSAVRAAPNISPLRAQIHQISLKSEPTTPRLSHNRSKGEMHSMHEDRDTIKSPFLRGGKAFTHKSHGDLPAAETDISFISNRSSTERTFPSPSMYDHLDISSHLPRLSNSDGHLDTSFESMMMRSSHRSMDVYSVGNDYSSFSHDSNRTSWSSQTMEDVEAEMKRLRLELKQTMDMYSAACKEALTEKQKMSRWKLEEEQRWEEARHAQEAAMAMAEKEKAKSRAALEAAEAAQRIAELEAQKRIMAEMKAQKESEEKRKVLDSLAHNDIRYRKYSIEEIEVATDYFAESRKIGEGGYGPVYKCYLDHTPVAIKVLRPDAAQGRSQFQQEVEVLSCIRHPNMVLLLGACPEYGCLVYEYLANGSLEDRLFRRGGTPTLSWQLRFRIAAEIATGLLFLHQTKPEPLVHRDLKPANILLDRNFVSKISDVGLARLVPPSVADNVTQYRMTSTAGTFCYIDPEYQQTGMLGIKSDVYSLGIMLLQLITGKTAMGLTHHVEKAIERGAFEEMLDPAVEDWPVEEALKLAHVALKCAELRRKDRPDLGGVVLPELERMRDLAEESMPRQVYGGGSAHPSPSNSQASMLQDVMSDPLYVQSGYDSSRSGSSTTTKRLSIT
ncbi:U-box domain-containing protein 34 [Acorus gramineus]|uniref:RING-type E3 ubiquitin transferase n=1 Tax=Acorus gramineus TaxID=55184 RepID=A0AAV9BNI4_ACOGR|nr:U-box domain-containing protein 34 [Acorus gramineus]